MVRFTKSCDENADEYQYPLLRSGQEPEPLSEVRFLRGDAARSFQFFVYEGGAFRFTGNLAPYPNSDGTRSSEEPTGFVATVMPRPGAKVEQAHLMRQVQPVYPSQPRPGVSDGEVVLRALIGVAGTAKDLTVIKGDCVFAKSAINAARQWRFSPMIVEEMPVEAAGDLVLLSVS